MAFLVTAKLMAHEFRGLTTGTSKKGTVFKTIRLEAPDGQPCEVSCTDKDFFHVLDNLRKGDVCNWDVRCVAGRDRSYIVLVAPPMVVSGAGEVEF